MRDATTHPSVQELSDFGLGRLPEAAAATVADHLETCPACQKAVADLPPDSFLGKVRASRPNPASVAAGRPETAHAPDSAAAPPEGLPPELASYAKYRFLRELGRGGMGVVYLAEQTLMKRRVAIKVINPGVLAHPSALPRFHAEVQAAATLDHPNIVRAFDAEQVGSLHLLVMEFVEGTNLADLVQRKGPLPLAHACHFIRQAALGLQHAFEQGMIHRDIKPQNLMVTPKGQVKVLDFGLARLRSGGRGLTEMGSFMGTPEYVSPEQATDAHTADTRADLYSLGCTLYFLLAGRPPFPEDTAVKVILAQIEKPAPPVQELRPEVPAELSAVVARLLAKDPAQRFQTPVELAQALVPFIKQGPKREGVSLPPLAMPVSDRGTVLGANTSKVIKPQGNPASKPSAPPAAVKDKGAAPLADLVDAVAPLTKEKRLRPAQAARAAWYRRWPSIAGGVAASVLLLGLIAMWAGGVFKVKTKDGTIVLANLPADAEVTVDGATVTVTWGADGKTAEVTVKPGTRKIVATTKGGVKVIGEEVEIADGGEQVLMAHVEPLKKGASPEDAKPAKGDSDGFVPLFSGKDLKGWKESKFNFGGQIANQNGVLVISAKKGKPANFMTQQMYSDFHIRAEVFNSESGDNGNIHLRCSESQNIGYMISCSQNISKRFSIGSLLIMVPETRQAEWQNVPDPVIVQPSQWFKLEIILRRNRISVYVEDRFVAGYSDPRYSFKSGFIRLGCWNEQRIRKLEIKELPAEDSEPAKPTGQGFVPLFNGKDRTGWVVDSGDEDAWQVKGGELVAIGDDEDGRLLMNQGYLLTEREYSDFVLRFQFQQVSTMYAWGGVALRAVAHETVRNADPTRRPEAVWPLHLTVILGQVNPLVGPWETGSLWWKAGSPPCRPPDNLGELKKAGEWNDMEVEMRGQSLRIAVNGRDVQNVMLDKTRPDANSLPGLSRSSGRIGFLKRAGEVRYRNIEIKELPAKGPGPQEKGGLEARSRRLDEIAAITAKKEHGYLIGKVAKGETITLQYVSGKWKAWGRYATQSPDEPVQERGDQCRLAICEAPEETPTKVLAVVPSGTGTRPYTWAADRDYEKIVLRINSPQTDFASNPDNGVQYRVTIAMPPLKRFPAIPVPP